MRNTKIALAVLALVASTAAMADGASVYGHIDASVSKQSNQAMQFGEGNWDSSVFGVKGSEDLENGGMKATYNLEIGYNSGNGAMANGGTQFGLLPNPVFNRAANVGLVGDFGSVKLGLQISPMIVAQLAGVATGNQSFNVNMLAMAGSVASTVNANSSGVGLILLQLVASLFLMLFLILLQASVDLVQLFLLSLQLQAPAAEQDKNIQQAQQTSHKVMLM